MSYLTMVDFGQNMLQESLSIYSKISLVMIDGIFFISSKFSIQHATLFLHSEVATHTAVLSLTIKKIPVFTNQLLTGVL